MKIIVSVDVAQDIHAAMKNVLGDAGKWFFMGLRNEGCTLTVFGGDGSKIFTKTYPADKDSEDGIIYTPLFDKPKGKFGVVEFESDGKTTCVTTFTPSGKTVIEYNIWDECNGYDVRPYFKNGDGEGYTVYVNPLYLVNLLKSFSGNHIRIDFSRSALSPVTLVNESGTEKGLFCPKGAWR